MNNSFFNAIATAKKVKGVVTGTVDPGSSGYGRDESRKWRVAVIEDPGNNYSYGHGGSRSCYGRRVE